MQRITVEQVKQFEELHKKGYSISEIAKKTGSSSYTVRYYENMDFKIKQINLTKEEEKEILKDFKEGKDPTEIAKKFEIQRSRVYFVLRKQGVENISRKTPVEIDRDWFEKEYNSGRSIESLAKETKHSTQTIRKYLDKYGLRKVMKKVEEDNAQWQLESLKESRKLKAGDKITIKRKPYTVEALYKFHVQCKSKSGFKECFTWADVAGFNSRYREG